MHKSNVRSYGQLDLVLMLRVWPRFDVTGTGSHMTGTGSDVMGTRSHMTGSDWKWEGHVIWDGKPLTSGKNRSRAQKREDIS